MREDESKCGACGSMPRSIEDSEIAELIDIRNRLVRVLNAYEGGDALISNQGQALDGYSALANFVSIARRASDLKITEAE